MPGWMKWAVALAAGFAFIVLGWRLSDSRWFSWLLPTFFVVNCLFLIIVVLLQSGKAADIAGAFGGAGSQTAFGPRGAATVLSRATTWCAVMFMVCALALVLHTDKGVGQSGSVLEKFSKPAPVKPAAPKTLPLQPGTPQSTPNNTPAPTTQPPANSQPAPTQPKKP
jgi:preprotein translocase subunit SecG